MNQFFEPVFLVLLVALLIYIAILATRLQQLKRSRALMQSVAPSVRVRDLAADPAKRVQAMRIYREETGADVRVAKAVVDVLAVARP